MNTINNFYQSVIRSFQPKRMELLGGNFLAPKMVDLIFDVIIRHKLKVISTECHYVHYGTDTGLDIVIIETRPYYYDIKINNDDVIRNITEDKLNETINDELEIL